MARKHFVPLESDPIIFTELLHKLGVSDKLSFVDVLSLDDAELLAFIPRPVLGLIFIFPGTDTALANLAKEEAAAIPYTGAGENEDVVWFRQTIGNACGLYGILHVACNGKARDYIQSNSTLDKLLQESTPLDPAGRAHVLESSPDLEAAHAASAQQGQSTPPPAEEHPSFAYTAFTKSHKSSHMYELAGYVKGPRDLGMVCNKEEDLLSDNAMKVLKAYVDREMQKSGSLPWGFNVMALVQN
ncbi:cysteine proteinase [Calocera viscosa TUFC12733]|uniref:Ubiquitin carboxyl-terminal hydrolase n=1 Tax=Calocera viscosa (strain TUFC12733) TaxID=1330018 RepID=A0A167FW83_CALVF|nr:cysteine proteinase [Calocera viscosa TUFC12733]